jgi:signal transduction histidine kinase
MLTVPRRCPTFACMGSAAVLAPPERSWVLSSKAVWVCTVAAAGTAAIAVSLLQAPTPDVYLLLLLAAAILAEAFPVPIQSVSAGNTSLASIFIATAATLYGWQYGCLVGAGAMLVCELLKRARLERLGYNVALYSLGGLAAGWAASLSTLHYQAAVLAMFAFYLTDVGLLVVVVSLVERQSLLRVGREFVPSTVLPATLMTAQTALAVILWRRDGPLYLLLLFPALAAIVYWQQNAQRVLEQRRRLDELKDEFIAVMSHEIRTPLAIIYGGIETMRRPDSEVPTETKRLLAETVRRESRRLVSVLEDVLAVNRIDRQPRLDSEPLALDSLCRAAAEGAAEYAPPEISFDLSGLCPVSGLGHCDSVSRILVNLVDNGIKYSPEGGMIRLRTDRTEGWAQIEVADEGVGIPESERATVFEKFHRLAPNETGGTGLGLYICRELARLVGGEISIAGNHPRGTRVIVRLPLAEGGER